MRDITQHGSRVVARKDIGELISKASYAENIIKPEAPGLMRKFAKKQMLIINKIWRSMNKKN